MNEIGGSQPSKSSIPHRKASSRMMMCGRTRHTIRMRVISGTLPCTIVPCIRHHLQLEFAYHILVQGERGEPWSVRRSRL